MHSIGTPPLNWEFGPFPKLRLCDIIFSHDPGQLIVSHVSTRGNNQ